MNIEEKISLVNSHNWWHSIDFGDGIVSKGIKTSSIHIKEEAYWFPIDFCKDKRVLDVGAWDGYYSFYAERMGAKEVIAVDKYVWKRENKRGFDIAKLLLNSKVKEYILDIPEMTPDVLGTFDSIIYAGVFYHLKNPFQALEILDSLLLTNGRILIESHMCNIDNPIPLMQYHPKASLNNDKTNFWSPNIACVKYMFEDIGDYSIEEVREEETLPDRKVIIVRKN